MTGAAQRNIDIDQLQQRLGKVTRERDRYRDDREALLTEVDNLREAFKGALEMVDYWKGRGDRYRVALEDFSCRLLGPGLGLLREDIEGLLREHGIAPQDFDE
jgi:hypothetical protein